VFSRENGITPIGIHSEQFHKAHIRLKIEIEIGLKFNQSKERKPISSLVNFALIGQNQFNLNLNL